MLLRLHLCFHQPRHHSLFLLLLHQLDSDDDDCLTDSSEFGVWWEAPASSGSSVIDHSLEPPILMCLLQPRCSSPFSHVLLKYTDRPGFKHATTCSAKLPSLASLSVFISFIFVLNFQAPEDMFGHIVLAVVFKKMMTGPNVSDIVWRL